MNDRDPAKRPGIEELKKQLIIGRKAEEGGEEESRRVRYRKTKQEEVSGRRGNQQWDK